MGKWDKFKNVFVLKWYSIVLSIGSIAFGFYLNEHPFMLESSNEYEVLSRIFGSAVFANAFIIFSASKLICIVFDWRKGKLISLSLLIALWTLFGVGFFIQFLNGITNGGWILVGIIVGQALGIIQRSDFHKGDVADE